MRASVGIAIAAVVATAVVALVGVGAAGRPRPAPGEADGRAGAVDAADAGAATELPVPAPGTGDRPDGSPDDWPEPTRLVPGTAGYAEGTWTYVDYVYDDRGAGGTFEYPREGPHGNNAADVVAVQVQQRAGDVWHLIRFNTMLAPDRAVVALAVDTDGDERTGGGPWPLGADVTTPGWELVITAWGTGAAVHTIDGDRRTVPVAADTEANTVEVVLPSGALDVAGAVGERWRYRGASGVWDPATASWAEVVAPSPEGPAPATAPTGGDGSPTQPDVFNLLFRNRLHDGGTPETDEETSPGFQHARQDAALAGGDLRAFHRDVDLDLLASGATRLPAEPPGDLHHTRLVAASDHPNGVPEGVRRQSYEGAATYNGRYHPYRLFVPEAARAGEGPVPLVAVLHPRGGDHRSLERLEGPFWEVARRHRALVAKPLGRGDNEWYEGHAELDVLDVLDDVARHHPVDPDRVFIGGSSMGGLGALKIAEAHPDRFAGVWASAAPARPRATDYVHPGLGAWDVVEHLPALRHVPVRVFAGAWDTVVPDVDADELCERLADLEQDHECWSDLTPEGTHRGYHHDRAGVLDALFARRRVRAPAHVTYHVDAVWSAQAAADGVEHLLGYEEAYWVSGIEPVAGEPGTLPGDRPTAVVDVESFGRGDHEPDVVPVEDHPDPLLHRRGLVVRHGAEGAAGNRLALSVAHVRALDLDLPAAGLTLAEPLGATVGGRGPLRLSLAGAHGTCLARLDGRPVAGVRHHEGRVVVPLSLSRPDHHLEVRCR